MSHRDLPFMLDTETVAEALNCSTAHIYNLVRLDTLPFPVQRIGKLFRFRRSDVEAFLGCPLEQVLGLNANDTEMEDIK